MGLAPAGAAHGFRGLGTPALLEVFGEQGCGTKFLQDGSDDVEVHRAGVPWDRLGPPTDMRRIEERGRPPRER
jgi:hypothetical protein